MADMPSLGPASGEIEIPEMPGAGDVRLSLSQDQGLRTTALMLAINYYTKTIVSDGVMYQTMVATGKNLEPAHHSKVLAIAEEFTAFLVKDVVREMVIDEMERVAIEMQKADDPLSVIPDEPFFPASKE